MTYAFTSEKGAEDFIKFLADVIGVEAHIGSYLHVEVDFSEADINSEEALWVSEKAEECGVDNGLL